jgi:hypothetical protein
MVVMAMVSVELHVKNIPEIFQMSKSNGRGTVVNHVAALHFWMALFFWLRYDDGEDELRCRSAGPRGKAEETGCENGNIF